MLYLDVKYKCKPGTRQEFYDTIVENGIDAKSRAEEGCKMYAYSMPEDDPDVLLLSEIWTSPKDQAIHMETEHFKKLGEFKEKYVLDTEIKKEEGVYTRDGKKIGLLQGSKQRMTFKSKYNEKVTRVGGAIFLIIVILFIIFDN